MSERSASGPVPRHPIGAVARRTGLKPDLIRAWERRYSAVAPGRSDTRRRFYTDADIERLQLLRRVVSAGHGIGQVAGLSNQELESLIEVERAAPPRFPVSAAAAEISAQFLDRCVAAAQRLDARDLEMEIGRASVELSRINLLERLLVPLMHRVGELWHAGTLRPIHEHVASAAVRSYLGSACGALYVEASAPHLLVTTPACQRHELGALVAAATAAGEGWAVTYLGPDLPAEEIAAAALQKGVRAVALSLTYPPDDPLLGGELRRLRRLLGSHVALIVGGRSAVHYSAILNEIEAERVEDLAGLRRALAALRGGQASRGKN